MKADKVTLVAERIDDGKLHATLPNGAVAIHPREIPDRFARDLSGDGIAAALLDVFACGRRELVQQRRPLKSPTVTSHRVSTNQQGHARRRERPKARLVVASSTSSPGTLPSFPGPWKAASNLSPPTCHSPTNSPFTFSPPWPRCAGRQSLSASSAFCRRRSRRRRWRSRRSRRCRSDALGQPPAAIS